MSTNLIAEIWHCPYGDASTILVLMALADEANDKGEYTAEMATIARKARQSERNCRYLLRRLERLEIIECLEQRGRGHKNSYRICTENLQNLQNLQKGQPLPVLEHAPSTPSSTPTVDVKPAKPATSACLSPDDVKPAKPAKPATNAGFDAPSPLNPLTLNTQDKDLSPPVVPPIEPEAIAKGANRVLDAKADHVLTYLNTILGRNYRVDKHIKARLRQGYTIDDCKVVIDWLHIERRATEPDWVDKYLDHTTPFREENFDKYLQRANEWKQQKDATAARPHSNKPYLGE